MIHLKCLTFNTILLVLLIETIETNPEPLNKLALNINIKQSNENQPEPTSKQDSAPELELTSKQNSKPEPEPTSKQIKTEPGPEQGPTSKSEQCGVKKPSSNDKTGIYFGEDAEMNEYPWIAALEVDGSYPHCGGSLIGSQWVLTARHCIVGARQISVTLGEHILNEKGESEIEKRFKVIHWFTFDDGDDYVGQDIALLKLRKPVDLQIYTPVCLPTDGDDMEEFVGKDAWVYGWGMMEDYDFPNTLQKVQIEVVSNDECSEAFEEIDLGPVTDGEVCAGDRSMNQTKDSCSGDSGGPLSLAQEEGRHTQIGVVSWGKGCGLPGLFGVYSNVLHFKDWIRETMVNN